MGLLQELEEERAKFEMSSDKTDDFMISQFKDTDNMNDMKSKAIEIGNKNSKLVSYYKVLLKQKSRLRERYKDSKKAIEQKEIEKNNEKPKNKKLTKDQLASYIDTKLDQQLLKAISNIDTELDICERVSKHQYMMSKQLENFSMLETGYQKYIRSNRL